jgi:tetratricopeptide (TPR) repeat protein
MRPLPRIKFIWGGAKVIRGRWYVGLFGFYDRVEGEPDSGLAISLRGLLAWGAAGAALGYVGLATAVHHVWQKNPYNRLTYVDAVLYPLRRPQIAEKKGQAFIAQGIDFFRQQKFHEAANLLRLGLARTPDDAEARKTLAQYYVLVNQRPLALRVLQEGLKDAYPGRAYLEPLFAAAEQAEDFAFVVDISGRYLPQLEKAGSEAARRWLVERRFSALSSLGRHAEALALAEGQGGSDAMMELRVIALLALQRGEDAAATLAKWREQPGANPAVIARLSVRTYRELGRFDDMTRSLQELRALAPADPAPSVFAVIQQAIAARDAAALTALEDYVFRFGGDVANLLLVAEPLGQINHVELLTRCIALAEERGYPLQRFRSLQVEALLHRGRWEEAVRVLATIPPSTGRDTVLAGLWRTWVERLVDVSRTPTDASQLALVDFLRQRPWPATIFKKTIDALNASGRRDAVRDVLALATRVFPASEWFKAEAEKVNALLAASSVAPGAAETVPVRSGVDVNDEAVFWNRLEDATLAAAWSDAAKLIHSARQARPAPAWLSRRDAELRAVHVEVAAHLRDRLAMTSSARLYLNGDPVRSQEMVDLARRVAASVDKELGVALNREVLRRVPDFEPAKVLQLELQPPQKDEPKG